MKRVRIKKNCKANTTKYNGKPSEINIHCMASMTKNHVNTYTITNK